MSSNSEVQPCPSCGSTRSSLFNQESFLRTMLTYRVCRACGLVYQSPRITAEQAAEYHSQNYRLQPQAGKTGINPNELAVQRARAATLTDLFAAEGKRVERHLDIGCSAGMMLLAFQEAFGCASTGIEVDAMFRPVAREQGLRVLESLDELQPGERFDVISMSHVLEHIPEPVEFLKKLAADRLTVAGCLYLEVPNLYGHVSFEVGHYQCYSPRTLREMLRRSGFRIERLTVHGRPRSRLVPLYLNVIARPAGRAASRPAIDRNVKLKWYAARLYRKACRLLFPQWTLLKIPGVVEKSKSADPEH